MATLKGSLDTFSLPDVLRLLASTAKSGLLWVETGDVNGRIYFHEGLITYASTRDLRIGEPDSGDRRIVDVDRVADDHSIELLQQQLTDVMVRLLGAEAGTFSFEDDTAPPHEIQHAFDVEAVLGATADRIDEWRRIAEVLPSVTSRLRLVPHIQTEEITLDGRGWAVVACLGSSGTAAAVAQELKVFEFAAAKKVAELIRRGLVELVDEQPSTWGDLGLQGSEEPAPVVLVNDAQAPAREEPGEGVDELWESLPDSEETQDQAETEAAEEQLQPGELARRWRELSNARQRADD